MIDGYVTETNAYNGYWLYRVFIDGEKLVAFVARPRLTDSEQADMVDLYTSAIEGRMQ